jgi:hypothetical protein
MYEEAETGLAPPREPVFGVIGWCGGFLRGCIEG